MSYRGFFVHTLPTKMIHGKKKKNRNPYAILNVAEVAMLALLSSILFRNILHYPLYLWCCSPKLKIIQTFP